MKWLNIIGLTLVIVVNILANRLPLNGMTTGEVSALYPNPFEPASITFSIWVVIYLFLAGYCVYPFITKDNRHALSISWPFLFTCILNISWIFAWHYRLLLASVIIILLLLGTLFIIYKKLHNRIPHSPLEKWLVYKSFGIYLAWIVVAALANVSAWLGEKELFPLSQQGWAIAMVILTQLVVYLICKRYKDIAFALVIIWATLGIIIRRADPEWFFPPVIVVSILAIIFDAFVALHYRYRKTVT